MVEMIVTGFVELLKFLLGILFEAALIVSPVRLARKLFFGVPLLEEPNGFFAALALYFLDVLSLLIAGFGVLLLFKMMFS